MAHAAPSWIEKKSSQIFTIFFVISFIYFWGYVNPRLIYQQQQPSFFTGKEFFIQHLLYPGGIAEYLSSFFSQFFLFPLLGALLITLVISALVISAFHIFKIFRAGKSATVVSLIIAGALVGMHSGYFYQLSLSLALLFPLLAFLLFTKLAKSSMLLRIILFIVLSPLLYFIVAAPFFVFVILSILSEFFQQREKWMVKVIIFLFFSGFGFLWPLFVHNYISLYNAREMYTFLLPFYVYLPIKVLPELIYLLVLLFPFALGLLHLISKDREQVVEQQKKHTIRDIVVVCFCFVAMAVVASFSLDKRHKVVLHIDSLAESQDWQQLLKTAKEQSHVLHRLITLHYNRALFHTGQLCDNLFGYPQIEGEDGLYRNSGPAFDAPFALAALAFEMANPNSAQCWANEALSIEGQSARVLKQLAIIHIQKGEYDAAAIYLNKLSKTLFSKKWAQHYKNLLQKPSQIKDDPLFAHLGVQPVTANYLIRYGQAYGELKYLYENNQQSKMAFEYLLAFHLLSRRLDRLSEMSPQILQMYNTNLPRHVEEAIILIAMSGVEHNIDLNALQFRQDYIEGFQKFLSIIEKHKNNTQYAQAELSQAFGDTYWYYHLYHQPQELQ